MGKWMPIETAPKDSSTFIAADIRDGYQLTAYDCWWYKKGGFWESLTNPFPEPTHWMPLPEPPDA